MKLFKAFRKKDSKDLQVASSAQNGTQDEQAEEEVKVHPLSDYPDEAWIKMGLSKTIGPTPIRSVDDLGPVTDKKLRFVCISDTHLRFEMIEKLEVPYGDVLLHCGDFTLEGTVSEVRSFNKYLGTLPHRHKVVIAGNHDQMFDRRMVNKNFMDHLKEKYGCSEPRDLLSNGIYLEDEMLQIAGIQIYGSPWVAEYRCDAFALERGAELLEKWKLIPSSVDVLMTHSPPLGAGDLVKSGHHVGCVELINVVRKRVKPVYHVFGHIHEGYGMFTDGTTTFINASMCNNKYQPRNEPIVFDLDIPKGFKKGDPVLRIHTQSGKDR